MTNIDRMSNTLYYQLADQYEVSAIYHHDESLMFRVRPYQDSQNAKTIVKNRIGKAGFSANFTEDAQGCLITIKRSGERKIPWLNLVLFIITLGTMYYVAPGNGFGDYAEFVISLILILLFHEFGHYFAGRRRGVIMSLPYFIPAPNIVGTFGAVIKSKSPFTSRRDLIEVGATGPIAGFIIAVIVLIYGLQNAEIVQSGAIDGLMLGSSLLMQFLTWLVVGPIPEGYDFALSPAGWAGWVGLFITMINLLPIGQLDGGHILYGLAGRYQHRFARLFLIFMAIMGFWWFGWWFFGVMAFVFGINHPPTLNDGAKLPLHARLMAYVSILIFFVSFIPVPFLFG